VKKIGKTYKLETFPQIEEVFTVVGKKEGEGPLGIYFDMIIDDEYVGAKTWELAESKLLAIAVDELIKKSNIPQNEIDIILSGDLLNQLTASSLALKNVSIPFIGLYGACSTLALSLSLSAIFIESGATIYVIAATSSHFCSAEKQFRYPLELGSQRTPTSQWTVTGASAYLIKPNDGSKKPKITNFTIGKMVDMGIKDANNMGAAMAPAAKDTIVEHFNSLNIDFDYYDVIATGDLGYVGRELLVELLKKEGFKKAEKLLDCGILIYDTQKQDTHAGGSGCACSACVFGGYLYKLMLENTFERILLIPTGALMSPSTVQQGESITGIAHALSIEIL